MNKTKFFGSLLVAALFASTSVFTSCKDYDDDINHLQTEIDALKSTLTKDLGDLQTKLTNDLNNAKSELQTAINNKADASTVEALAGRVAALETQLEAVKTSLDNYAKKSDLDNYAKKTDMDGFVTYAALTGELDNLKTLIGDEEAARKAADQNIQLQIDALKSWQTIVNEANYQGQIDALKSWQQEIIAANYPKQISDLDAKLSDKIQGVIDDLGDFKAEYAEDQEELEEKMNGFSDDIAKLNTNVNILNVLVNKILTSISLVPDLYVNGIEAIEFKSLRYKEVVPGTSGLTYKGNEILVDNGTAEATYRLNPSTVKRESLDEEKFEYKAAIAEARETRAVSDWCPVLFNGVKSFNNGLMTVYLKKNTTNRLTQDKNGKDLGNKIWIVALNTPRKADADNGQEAADVISENSRLVETTIWPRIAKLPWTQNLNAKLVADDNGTLSPIHHYSDSAVVWKSKVDANPLQMVYEEVVYNKSYDLLPLVTGCYDKAAGTDNEITKDELKKYGLTFRFYVPTTAYKMDVDHVTDQQQFAVVDEFTGKVTSKLPNGVTDNKACVGKEPIIRIELVDTVRGKIVDQRYTKIKWIEKKLEPVTLDPYTEETTLKPCEDNVAKGIKWDWFINQVYAKAADLGLSQATFEAVYPVANIQYSDVTMSPNYTTPALLSPTATPAKPVVAQTTNAEGDALIANWTLTPQEIARIYPSQSKTFSCTITFKSFNTILYPDLKMTYSWTIKLPALPEINGYYDNYWFTKYELHDVLPVQYNTALYNQIANVDIIPRGGELETYNKWNNTVAPGTDYCVYFNNLMNAFTYEEINGVPTFIVKGIYNTCGTWDMQFAKNGADKFAGAINNNKTYTQYNHYAPRFTDDHSPLLDRNVFWDDFQGNAGFGAYKFDSLSTPRKQALQLVWGDAPYRTHTSWCGNIDHKAAILYADHHNVANQNLINPLSDEYESDNLTPKRTHDKKIRMGIWATLNDWNIIPIKDYDICLVAPLRIDAALGGAFEEGYVSGTAVECDAAFTMTDFRGYTVAQTNGSTEWTKYATKLWNYYEVEEPVWDLENVRYGMKKSNGNVVADDNLTYAQGMTAAQLETATNGNIVLSVTRESKGGKWYLVFRNNGGSNVEEEVNVFIPVSVEYGFGKVTKFCKVRLYPKGKVPTGVRIIAF